MKLRSHLVFAAFAASLVTAALSAQALPVSPAATTATEPAAGTVPGTQRWIAHFTERPFSLDALRAEYRSGADPEKIAKIVADLEARAKEHQAAFAERITKLGGRTHVHFWIVNACAFEIAPKHLDAIRELPLVARLEADVIRTPHAPIRTATNSSNHHIDELHALGLSGSGIAIAIADSGHDSNMNGTGVAHVTYSTGGTSTPSRLVFNKKLGLMVADDVSGHGTAVASCAAGWFWGNAAAGRGAAFGAKIAGYSVADFANGNAFSSTLALAWQSISADAAANKVKVGNLSYGGDNDPLSAQEQASDNCANVTDVLVCTSAGNSAADISGSSANLNGLAVGAVDPGTHNLSSFSARGFMATAGTFPDITANGLGIVMALRDNEIANNANSGTSFASPLLAGAATQLRAAVPSLTALETKAILLASTEQNPGAGAQQLSGVGCGYLRSDKAYQIATNPQMFGRAMVSTAGPIASWDIRVKTGQLVQVAITWHRTDTTKADFSDLNLHLLRGSTVIASAASGPNTEEFLRFTATADEVLTVRANAFAVRNTPQQEFAWAANVESATRVFPAQHSGSGFGNVVINAGDVNADGYDDFAIGHGGATSGASTNAGVFLVFSGRDYAALNGGGTPGSQNQRAGTSLASADMNGDGRPDIVYGAPGLGTTSGQIRIRDSASAFNNAFVTSTTVGLGEYLTVAPYLDEDGVPDILATDNGNVELVAYSGKLATQLWRVTPIAGVAIRALATVGDVNGDGRDDVILGLPAYNGNRGTIEIRSGATGGLIRFTDGAVAGESLGASVAGIGDVDGDGVKDYLFGSPDHPGAGTKRGNAAVQSGRTGTFMHVLSGATDNGGFGYAVSSAGGDVDTDGTPDFLVSSVGGGVLRVYSGKDARLLQTVNGPSATFGAAIAGVLASGDDQPDYLVSEPGFARATLYHSPHVSGPPAFIEFGVPCLATGIGYPRLGLRGRLPRIGRPVTVTLASAPTNAPASLEFAGARSAIDLSSLTLNGCFLHVVGVASLATSTNATGQGSATVAIPFTPALVGGVVHLQWICIDAAKAPFPIALSTGGTLRVGAGHY